MCSSKSKLQQTTPASLDINGRPVLQPNQVPLLERRNLHKKSSKKSVTPPKVQPLPTHNVTSPKLRPFVTTPPISPKLKSPRQPAIKRGNDPNGLNSSVEKLALTPKSDPKARIPVKKSKTETACVDASTLNYPSSCIIEAPGSIAAARREQVANMQVQRKMKIAHYGRSKSAKYDPYLNLIDNIEPTLTVTEDKRCSFITPNSGMIL